jgi:hypothetical protein
MDSHNRIIGNGYIFKVKNPILSPDFGALLTILST